MSAALPLDGMLVVELGQSVAGPYATMVLADLGARVVKIERPGTGDDSRSWYPPAWQGVATAYLAFNRGKESVVLDLKLEQDRETLRRLCERADVFVQNYRPGAAERLGFGSDALAALNPRLVYCDIGAFGREGPLRDEPGYDPLMQAFAGIMSVTGEEGRPPVRVGVSLVDMGTGMWCVVGILSALLLRQTSGRGMRVDAALFETALAFGVLQATGYLATGRDPGRTGSGVTQVAPHQAYPTGDGYLLVAAANEGLWRRLCAALEQPGLADHPRFVTNELRVRNRDELERVLTAALGGASAAQWEARIRQAGVPCSVLQRMSEVLAHPQTAASGMVQALPHPRIADFRAVGVPLRFDGLRPRLRRPPPALGEHTASVLRELGLAEGGRD